MTTRRWSSALTGELHDYLGGHLLRSDGQEDVCLATYRESTGLERRTAILDTPVLPLNGEREVHRTASFTTEYILRGARLAAAEGSGLAVLHSHPGGAGWQSMSRADRSTEAGYANLVRELTGSPMVGMTLAGDGSWSARVWDAGVGRSIEHSECENARVIRADRMVVSWNDRERPAPSAQQTQVRTVHCWGDRVQAQVARLRVLVVGAGSVGLTVAVALAATGIEHVAVMDHDTVTYINLDRLLGATPLDALVHRAKAELALRLIGDAATAEHSRNDGWEDSVCEPRGLAHALDFDVVFSCVDRPWPRYVLNTAAYADLIPVIDGGIHVDPFPHGGMRGAMWRSHVAGPGRPCLACIGQFHPSHIALERDGSLDNPSYIAGLPVDHPLRVRQNVSILSINCAGALLSQFISLVVSPGGLGDPGPLRYQLGPHLLQRDPAQCIPGCPYASGVGVGDARQDPTGRHASAEAERAARRRARRAPHVRLTHAIDQLVLGARSRLNARARGSLRSGD